MRRAAFLALLLSLAFAPSAAGHRTGRLLVSLDGSGVRARAAAPAVLARAAARRAGPAVPQIGLLTVRPAAGASLHATAERLRADSRVRAVGVERRARPRLASNDPALSDPETAPGTPPGTVVQWWALRLGLPEAWDVARGSTALVAVVDSGADGAHPDLQAKIRHTVDADPDPRDGGPLSDRTGHGTHVAALACAAAGNGIGIAGAGLDCGLIIAKTDFTDSSVARAIVESADLGAHAINLSFGTDGARVVPTAVQDALHYATGKGAVLVAAAADQATEEQGDPANLLQPTGTGPHVGEGLGLSVTAATFSDGRAGFAGRGTQISLAAYGAFEPGRGPRGLLSAWPHGITTYERGDIGPPAQPPCGCRTTYRGDPRYAYLQGTSMSAALVSAVAALVRDLNPDLPPADVVRLLKETARRPAGTGWTPELGWGIVDARAAVAAARLIDRHRPGSSVRAARPTRSGAVTLRLSGVDEAPPGVVASGIDRYELWRSSYGRRAVRLTTTRSTTLTVRRRPGGRYAFFSVAVDRAGNREAAPPHPDATVRALGARRSPQRGRGRVG
jgi:subtilisin family serine protease